MHIYTQMLVTKIAANQKSCNAQKIDIILYTLIFMLLFTYLSHLEHEVQHLRVTQVILQRSTLMLLARTKGKYFTEQNQKMYY